nr:MAG TPA: hypothetical protein [Caudoviricetes sp.]
MDNVVMGRSIEYKSSIRTILIDCLTDCNEL